MSTLNTTILAEENYDSFLRPAIYDSIIAVLDFYGLRSATNIYYNGATDVVKLIGNAQSDGQTADRFTDGTFRNKIFITAEVEDSEFWDLRRDMTERPVFLNPELPLIICPSFEGKQIRVQVVSRFNTEAQAKAFVSKINRQRKNQVVDFNFTPTVHMLFNKGLVRFVDIIHAMLKKNEPAIPELQEWFGKYAQFNFTGITNVAGKLPQVVVPLKPNNIGISFTDPFVAKVRKGSAYGQFEVEFSYTFFFNSFLGWEVEYPLNVYQEQIPEEYIPRPQPGFTANKGVTSGPEVTSGREINPPIDFIQSPYFLKLPLHDPFTAPYEWWIQPVVQAQLALKDLPEQVIGNIFELPEFKWRPKAVEYIKRRHAVAFMHHETPFLFRLFAGNRIVPAKDVRMDEDGTITLLTKPNLKLTYHLVACIDYAIRDYSKQLWDDVGWDDDGYWGIIRTIFNWIDFNKFPKPWVHNIPTILHNIDLGHGRVTHQFNVYQGLFGIVAHNAG